MTELQVLNDLADEIRNDIDNNIPNINCGGCGIFAERLYKVLDKMGYNPTIAFVTRYPDDWDSWLKLSNRDKTTTIQFGNLDPFCHVMVKCDGYYFDSSGMYHTLTHHPMNEGRSLKVSAKYDMDIQGLRELLKLNIWSDIYERSNTKIIVKKLGEIYKNLHKKLVKSKKVLSLHSKYKTA